MIKKFPSINNEEDSNPAIKLFGKRFISNQSISELLIEFLLVIIVIGLAVCITKNTILIKK